MDTMTRSRRSWAMSRIRGKDTKSELALRQIVFGLGYRYRLHGKALPGKPDLVFKSRRKVIFVHGCFWHGHAECQKAHSPKSNTSYWQSKIAGNIARDARNLSQLAQLEWDSLVVWECELSNPRLVGWRVRKFLDRC